MKKLILFIIVSYSLLINNCFSQWQPDFRLTTSSADSKLSENNARCIETNGSIVHIVYYDYRDGNREIYYKRSTDNGTSWATGLRLTNNSALSDFPSAAVSGSNVHVVWEDDRDGNYEIYYKRSTDDGINWGSDLRLTSYTGFSLSPSVAVYGPVVHVVWDDNRDGNFEIYYKRSTDGGFSWGNDTRLTSNSAASWNPCIAVSSSNVHVVWHDFRDGNAEIYYKRSTDGGFSWGNDSRLTNNSADSYLSSVSVSGSVVHITWKDSRDGNWEIYYKRSTDGGINWGSDTRLTSNSSISNYPSVIASGLNIHVVWSDNRDGNYEIYYNRSTDGGINWESDTRLTNNNFYSEKPFITVSGSSVHVAWEDNRNGNYSIYYKQNPTGNPIGIKNISTEVPKEFKLEQNFPNPFNPATKIRFAIPSNVKRETSNVKLIIFDILGREIASLVNEELNPGTYEVSWDGSNYSSGVYYYKIESGGFVETKKMVLIK